MGLVFAATWQAGLALIDEAAAAAASGQLDLRSASDIYCNTIAACRNVGRPQAGGPMGGRRRALDASPGGRRLSRHLPRPSRRAQDAPRPMVRGRAGGPPGLRGARTLRAAGCRRATPSTRSARSACGWATWTRPAKRSTGPTSTGTTHSPGMALLHLARGEVDEATRSIGRALAATAHATEPTDRATRARLLPAQIDIALAAGDLETAGPAVDELESIAADFQRPVFEAGALTARGELFLGEDRPAEASPLLGRSWRLWQADGPALRERPGAPPLCRGDGRRRRPGGRSAGPARCPQRVRAARRQARSARGWTRCSGGGAATSAARSARAGDPDVHVHRHRHLHRPRRADRRRRLGRAAEMARPGAAIGVREPPRRGGQAHRRRLLRRLRASRRRRRVRGRHPAAAGAAPPRARVRAARCASACTPPRRHARAATTRAAACTSPPASAPPRRARRSSSRARPWARWARSAFGLSDPRQLTLKGVEEPVEVRSVDWR